MTEHNKSEHNKPEHEKTEHDQIDSENHSKGRFAYDGLERVIHEKARLGIMSSLVASPLGLMFNELKEVCALTDGNLSRHLQVLQEAGLVEVWKRIQNKRTQTLCRITPEGLERFVEYITVLEQVVEDAAQSPEALKTPNSTRDLTGWSPA